MVCRRRHDRRARGLAGRVVATAARTQPTTHASVRRDRDQGSSRVCSRDSAMSDVILLQVPYCGSVVLEDSKDDAKVWRLIEPPYPSLIHAPNPHFDWKALND